VPLAPEHAWLEHLLGWKDIGIHCQLRQESELPLEFCMLLNQGLKGRRNLHQTVGPVWMGTLLRLVSQLARHTESAGPWYHLVSQLGRLDTGSAGSCQEWHSLRKQLESLASSLVSEVASLSAAWGLQALKAELPLEFCTLLNQG